jgi:hypothetical protein
MQVLDAYALMGDVGGMAEKMQSYFLQEVLSETHCVLKEMLEEVIACSFSFYFTYDLYDPVSLS